MGRLQRHRDKWFARNEIGAQLDKRSMLDECPYPAHCWDRYYTDADEAAFIEFGEWVEYLQSLNEG